MEESSFVPEAWPPMPHPLLPEALHPWFRPSWTPWGKRRPVQALLKTLETGRHRLNTVFDFEPSPSRGWHPVAGLDSGPFTLLEAWHTLHADRWEADLLRLDNARRPCREDSAWVTFLLDLKAVGMPMTMRQRNPSSALLGRPRWFDDAGERPRLTRFWLDQGIDPGERYDSGGWNVWLGVSGMTDATVQLLIERGSQPGDNISSTLGHAYTALAALGSAAEQAVSENPGFWSSDDPRAARWTTIARRLVDNTLDLSAPVSGSTDTLTMLRQHFPTAWTAWEQDSLRSILDEPSRSTQALLRRPRARL